MPRCLALAAIVRSDPNMDWTKEVSVAYGSWNEVKIASRRWAIDGIIGLLLAGLAAGCAGVGSGRLQDPEIDCRLAVAIEAAMAAGPASPEGSEELMLVIGNVQWTGRPVDGSSASYRRSAAKAPASALSTRTWPRRSEAKN